MEKLATPGEVAERLGVQRETLTKWRYRGTGPRFCKVGRLAMYRWSDVEAWLEANTKTRTDDVA